MKTTRALAFTTLAALTVSLSGTAVTSAHAATTGSGENSSRSMTQATDSFAKSKAAKTVDTKAIYDRIVKKLPADWQKRRDAARTKLNIDSSPIDQALRSKLKRAAAASNATGKVINPDDYDCGPTKLDTYVDSILANVDSGNLFLLSLLGGLDIPTYDAILFGKPKGADYQLLPAYKTSLTTTFTAAQNFWDVQLNNVQLMAMHGDVMTDENRVAATVEYMYGVGPADATDIARDIISIVKSDPGLKNGKNPLFTLNAFAFTGEGDPDPVIRKLKDKMVFGDGILKALKALGLNKVGPKAVLGHEMAHHVQYEDDLFDSDLTGAEATRRTELMADAFGTYFVTHKKGLGFNPNQVLQTQQSFYDVGDCSFDSDGHHGTPNQRRAASAWGAAVVAYSNNPNKVLPSLKLDAKFEKALPQLVKPDAATSLKAYAAAAK